MNEFFPCTLTLFQIFFYVNSFFSEEAKIRFLDVLYNSEYFDTNISNFFFSQNHSFSVKKQKCRGVIVVMTLLL